MTQVKHQFYLCQVMISCTDGKLSENKHIFKIGSYGSSRGYREGFEVWVCGSKVTGFDV